MLQTLHLAAALDMSTGDDGSHGAVHRASEGSALATTIGTMALPLTTLSSLLSMQEREDDKPRLSKISWLPDILVFRASILPTVLLPVMVVTCFSAMVAVASVWWGKDVGLTNNVVPLLSVVVGLLLVFRNSSAYERYAEGRKDFTSLISNARNLSRLIWVVVCLPSDSTAPTITRAQLTEEKKGLIRLIIAFVVSTKHHLRAEGGVHHADLRGLLPPQLAGPHIESLKQASAPDLRADFLSTSPGRMTTSSPVSLRSARDEEAALGLASSRSILSHGTSTESARDESESATKRGFMHPRSGRGALKRRPTAVRVVIPHQHDEASTRHLSFGKGHAHQMMTERTPLIKAGVRPDVRKSVDDGMGVVKRAERGLGRMVELGLPLIIAHEISRTIFRFRRRGYLETVGPAGVNAMQALVQGMTDQLGSMERVVQTPMPYIIAVHMKQATTMLLFVLPFTLVDTLKVKMVPIMFFIALIYMGIEGIAAQVEQPFGNDPCDLNLDLFCTELLCECEAILERLPEGDEDEHEIFSRRAAQAAEDLQADDGGDDGGH